MAQLQEQFGKGIGQMLFDGTIQLHEALDGLRDMTLKELRKEYTLSVFSDNFTERFARLYDDVKLARQNGSTLNQARQDLALDKVWHISNIDKQVQNWLGANTDKVWLSEDTLVKQFFNHAELGVDVYHSVPYLLKNADLILKVDELKIAFLNDGDEMYKIVIKTTKEQDEIYLVSVFKMKTKEWERSKEKGEILFERKTGG